MQGVPDVVAFLNRQLTNELTAINQYFLHARIYRHWNLHVLGKREYQESLDEMKHADRLVERILMLNGLPNLQDLHKLLVGETVPEILSGDLTLERASQTTLKDAIACSETQRDFASRSIFVDILRDTEDHIDWLETQLELVERIGLANYQQSMIGTPGDD